MPPKPEHPSLDRSRRTLARVLLVVWAVCAVALAIWLRSADEGAGSVRIIREERIQIVGERTDDWIGALKFLLVSSKSLLIWFLFLPVMVVLAKVFTFDRGVRLRNLAVHLVAGFALSLLAETLVSSRMDRSGREAKFLVRNEQDEDVVSDKRRRLPDFGMIMFQLRRRSDMPVYWAVLLLLNTLRYYERAQERERHALDLQVKLNQARLEALRAQLHPHFLFNALHAVSTLIPRDPAAANDALNTLAELLRASLAAGEKPRVPLAEELEFVDKYLRIQEIRFGETLRVQKRIEPDTLDCEVPPLILQPLVENALKHSVERSSKIVTVGVEAARQESALRLRVWDDGPGASGALREGVGLRNLRERLREIYGADQRMEIMTDAGFSVTICIPARRAPAAHA